MSTLNRLLESVFEGKRFEQQHLPLSNEEIEKAIKEIPFTLSAAQKSSVFQALNNDITYIQGPPGTGKSYTISALAILASKLGLKTLVASQKKPAVEIVYSKVSELIGEEGCLFLSDNPERKESTKDLLQSILGWTTNSQLTRNKQIYRQKDTEVQDLIKERDRYAERIKDYQQDIKQFFESNETIQRLQKNLLDTLGLPEEVLRKVKRLENDEIRDKLIEYIDECRRLRKKSFDNDGKLGFANKMRLNVLVTTILKNLELDIDVYKKYQEEILEQIVRYSREARKSIGRQNLIRNHPIDSLRVSLNDITNQLYPQSNTSNSLLSQRLRLKTKIKIEELLEDRSYVNTLSDFKRRLHWRTARKVKEWNRKINFEKLFEIFPIVLGEIRTLHPFLPFKEELFDLVIVDEASQVNLAEIIPILFRAKRFCIVGDHKQLGIKAGGVIFLNKVLERLVWQKRFDDLHKINLSPTAAKERDLLVSTSSVLDLIRNENNDITSVPVVLNEHFRSMPMLAEFTNNEFYKSGSEHSGLKIMTALPQNKCLNSFMDIPVKTKREKTENVNAGEVKKVVSLIKSIAAQKPIAETKELFSLPPLKGKVITVGVVSFMRDQVKKIDEVISLTISADQLEKIDFMVGTPEDFQGNERDVMVMAPGVDEDCSRSRAFMENENRFNVASSRAKFYTYFVHGELPSNMMRMKGMLSHMGIENEQTSGQVEFTPIGWDFSRSDCDSDFEHLVADNIEDFIENEAPNKLMLFNQVNSCGYFLDFVVYDKQTKKSLAIEVDGKHHFFSDGSTHTDEHLERIMTLRRAGWDTHHLDYWNWFQDGWIEKDAPAVEALKEKLRNYFLVAK